jgi:PAS domain S-box-containing protein
MAVAFRFVDWPLRAKIAALLVAASLLPLAIWAYIDLRQDEARLLNSMSDLLAARGDQIVHELDTFHRSYRRSVDRLMRMPNTAAYCAEEPSRRVARHAEMLGILSSFPASDAGIRGVALIDAAGRVMIATETPLIGLDLADRPAVRNALKGRSVIADPFISSPGSGSVPTIAYLAPLLSADQRVVCLAVVWVRATTLWDTVRSSNALAGPGSFAVVFDREGIRIAHSYSDDIVFRPAGQLDPATLDRLVAERRFGTRTRALLEDVRDFPEQFTRARAATPNLSVFRGFAPVNRTWNYGVARRFDSVPWTLFYMVPEANLAAQVADATRQRLLLAAAMVVAAAVIGLALATMVLRPIRALDKAAASIAQGDLSARVPHPHGDEVGRLGTRFNAMAEQIEAHADDLQRSRDALDQRVRERTAELQSEIDERARIDGVLRERDAALHRAHVMTKLAHVITRPDGSFESWSETLPPMIGVAPAQMPQSTREWMALLHAQDRAKFRSASIAAGVNGASKDLEYRLRRADGEWIHVRQVIEPIPGQVDADGKMRWFSTLQDVTDQRRAADELRESQQLLQAIIDNSAAVIYVKALDGRYLLVNRRYVELFQISVEAVLGKTDHDLFAKPAADAFRSMDQRVASANAPLIEEETVPLEDGPHAFISVKCPLRDQAGKVYGVFGISTDITDRKQAELKLRASEERTRLIVETALDAVVTMDPAGRITGWNPQAETTFGWTQAEAMGTTLSELIIPPRYRDAHHAGLERYLATGEASVFNKRIELSALHRDGREFPIDLSITPIRTGDAVSFGAFVRDITDRKQSESRLKAQVEHLELLDQITRAIAERQDLQSIYQVAIRSLEERLPVAFAGVLRYDALDNTLTVIRVGVRSHALAMELALDEQSRIGIDQNGLSRCVQGELVYEPDIAATMFPFPQRLARGGLRSLVVAPLQSESRVFGILVAARDRAHAFSSGECEFLRQLSTHVALAAQQAELHAALQQAYDDLRQTQQTVMQQERLRALGQMASGIAHDINNAISPVALYTENLLEREANLSEGGRAQLVTIARAIDDVAATVARMREFYREREAQLEFRFVELNALVQQVIDLTRARWSDMPQQRGAVITLDTDLAPDLPAIEGIESEVREALINLVFNAVDAMPEGGVLTLRTRQAAAPVPSDGAAPGQVLVEVRDTGIGMDESTRRRCLEPFFTTKGERGTGLGLAMVYGAVQRHGASVDIESAVGRGTTVRLSFPIPEQAPVASAVYQPFEAPASRLRILVIDDDPVILASLCYMLEADGHLIVSANNGQAGIDAFRVAVSTVQAFDAVITDLGMPNIDGRKVADAVKASDAGTPVILLTGWGQRLLAEGDTPSHVDRVLSKPPKMREVRAALARLTQRTGAPSARRKKEAT